MSGFYNRISKSDLIEDRILTYLWDRASDRWRKSMQNNYKAGAYDAMCGALDGAALKGIYVPEELLKEAEEVAVGFINVCDGDWTYFALDPIEDIRTNNAKLLVEGKVPPDVDRSDELGDVS